MTYYEFRMLQIGDTVVIPKAGGIDAGKVCRVISKSLDYGLVAAKPIDTPLESNMNKRRQIRRAKYDGWIIPETKEES